MSTQEGVEYVLPENESGLGTIDMLINDWCQAVQRDLCEDFKDAMD